MQTGSASTSSTVDHLVVLAATLAEGALWCQLTLGIAAGPVGEHPLMGTHNHVLNISGPGFARTYLEIIAINPLAASRRSAGHKRWFDMDDPLLQARVAQSGPQLVHFVASVGAVVSATRAFAATGLDRGEIVSLSRQSAAGLLVWRITVRGDGQRLFYGGLPTLIQWGDAAHGPAGAPHPVDSLPACGLTLESLEFCHPRPDSLRRAYETIALSGVELMQGPPNLLATLMTPLGRITLQSHGA